MNIELKNITKSFEDAEVLHDISLSFENGMYGLLGANGAGKTTLIKIMGTLLAPDQGKIYFDGEEKSAAMIRAMTGYIPQHFSFFPNRRVWEVMDYFCALNEISVRVRKQLIGSLLEKTGLEIESKKRVRELSGGMVQRLGIAVALIKEPSLLLVDEPTVGLDPMERMRFKNILMDFAKDKTVLMSTHIVSDIEDTCRNITILDEGNVIFHGLADSLIDEANGKVWMLQTEENSELLSKDYIVAGKSLYKGRARVNIISPSKPVEGALAIAPKLEEAYLYKLLEADKR